MLNPSELETRDHYHYLAQNLIPPIVDSSPAFQNHHHQQQEQQQQGFICKIYAILSFQLSFTAIACFISIKNAPFAKFQLVNFWLGQTTLTLNLLILFWIHLNRALARQFPLVYILLGMFTLTQSYTVSYLCTLYDSMPIFISIIIIASMTIALMFYNYITKREIPLWFGLIFVAGCGCVCFVVLWAGLNIKSPETIISIMVIMSFGSYLIYATQLISNSKIFTLSYHEYAIGALEIYVGIIDFVLYMLELLTCKRNWY